MHAAARMEPDPAAGVLECLNRVQGTYRPAAGARLLSLPRMLAVLAPVQSDVSAVASVVSALAALVTVFHAHSTVRKADETSERLGQIDAAALRIWPT